jgi:hypothetical protein
MAETTGLGDLHSSSKAVQMKAMFKKTFNLITNPVYYKYFSKIAKLLCLEEDDKYFKLFEIKARYSYQPKTNRIITMKNG